MRRRVIPFNTPLNPLQGGKAGSKDPRNFVSGNVPGEQWDELQFAVDRADSATRPIPQISEVMRRHSGAGASDAVVRSVPTKVTTIAWTKNDTVHNNPVLLVPKNPNRIFLQLGNGNYIPPPVGPPIPQDSAQSIVSVFFSFGPPLISNITPQPVLSGHLLQLNTPPLIYSGDACPIDDVYVWWPVTGFFGGTIFYCAYEGVVAPEGN